MATTDTDSNNEPEIVVVDDQETAASSADAPKEVPPAGEKEAEAKPSETSEESPQEPDGTVPNDGPNEQEAESPPDNPDDVYDESGKLLGKFKTTADLANAYKELERHASKRGQEAGTLRKALLEAGYTIDEQGNPVAPTAPKPVAQQTTEERPSSPVTAAKYDDEGNVLLPVGENGEEVPCDPTTELPVVTEDAWVEYNRTNPTEAPMLRMRHEANQALERAKYNANVERHITEKAQVENYLKTGVPPAVADKLIAEIIPKAEQFLASLTPKQRVQPGKYIQAVSLLAGNHISEITQAAYNAGLDAGKSGRTVLAREGAPATAALASATPSRSRVQLTASEASMAKTMGLTLQEYAKYKDPNITVRQ